MGPTSTNAPIGALVRPRRTPSADRRTFRAMDLTGYRHQDAIVIERPPDVVYDLVADVSRMGEWSPVATGGEYDADDPTWFSGRNAIGEATWETRCRVVAADRGREFAFVNHGLDGRHELVRWGFRFEPAGDATELTQTWEVLPTYEQGFAEEGPDAGSLTDRLDMMRDLAHWSMRETLENLKAEAERS